MRNILLTRILFNKTFINAHFDVDNDTDGKVLLEVLGRKEEAQKTSNEKYDYFEKGSLDCGGRISRMSKPRGNNWIM